MMVLRKMKGLSHCLGASPSPSLTRGRNANEEDGEVATGNSLAQGAFANLLTLDKEELNTRKVGTRIPIVGSMWKPRSGGTQTVGHCSHRKGGVTVRLMITPQGMQEPSQDLTGDLAKGEFMTVS